MTTQLSTADTQETVSKRPFYQKALVMFAIMSTVGGTLTGIMTYMNLGITDSFFFDWFSSFIIAVLVLMPSGIIFMMLMNKLADILLPNLGTHQRNIVIGVAMAFIMESIMAASTAANNIGFSDMQLYLSAWGTGFLTALPFGLVMAVAMSLFIKPKLEKFMAS